MVFMIRVDHETTVAFNLFRFQGTSRALRNAPRFSTNPAICLESVAGRVEKLAEGEFLNSLLVPWKRNKLNATVVS